MSNILDAGAVAAPRSAVAWPAIFAGSVTGAAVSVILVLLGAGFGLSVVSPWGGGVSPTAFGVGAAIWLVIIEWVAAGFSGYFAGRLRTRLQGYHTDEVFFRDTAHGFVAWSFSLIILSAIFASSLAGIIGKTADAAATVASGAAQGAGVAAGGAMSALSGSLDSNAYLVDRLFRSSPGGMTGGANTAADSTAPATGTTTTNAPAASPAPSATTAPADTTAPAATAPSTDATSAPATSAPAPTDTTGAATTTDTTGAAAPAATPAPAATTAPAASPAPMAATGNGNGNSNGQEMSSNGADVRAEGSRILMQSITAGQISPEDRTYLAGLISQQAGISEADAEQRVDAAMTDAQAAVAKAKEAADTARSVAAKASLFLALSLLVGAFIACVAAALGGKERDDFDGTVAIR
jgi:hypothetical protein